MACAQDFWQSAGKNEHWFHLLSTRLVKTLVSEVITRVRREAAVHEHKTHSTVMKTQALYGNPLPGGAEGHLRLRRQRQLVAQQQYPEQDCGDGL
jgi:hypothetical protein